MKSRATGLSVRFFKVAIPLGKRVIGSSIGRTLSSERRAGICEAVTRASVRFVATKTPEQQSCLMLHRTRHLFIRQQTAVINAIRAHLAEFGVVAPVGRNGVEELLKVVADARDERVPEIARACLGALGAQLRALKVQILEFDRRIMAWHRSNEASKRLDAIPGVGPALATALVASVADPRAFRSGRDFSALDRARTQAALVQLRTSNAQVVVLTGQGNIFSTGDFEEALVALLGKEAGGLSASTVGRLKDAWSEEHVRWSRRDLSAKRYVYFWVDGIHVQARLEDDAQCLLVIIGATPKRDRLDRCHRPKHGDELQACLVSHRHDECLLPGGACHTHRRSPRQRAASSKSRPMATAPVQGSSAQRPQKTHQARSRAT